jgi:hypothetical protein
MNDRVFGLVVAIAAMLSVPNPGRTDALDVQKVLDQITNTADKICNVVSTKGEANSEEVKGSVKAQLSGLASKLADIGVTGSGAINNEGYQNVLQQDLAATLRDNTACKLKVFDTLQSKLLKSEETPPSVAAPNAPAGPKQLESMSCDELWHARNEIFARNGYCFETPRAQAVFGKGCFPPYGKLQGTDKDRVSEIEMWERRKDC